MDNLPHILHVIPTLASGGAEGLLLTYLSNPEMRDRFRHTIVLTDVRKLDSNDPGLHYAGIAEKLGIEIVCLGLPGRKHVPGCIAAIRRIIRERKVDLVHTHLLWANVAGRIAARLCGVPVITSFHNTDYDPERIRSFGIGGLKSSSIRWLDSLTSRLCLTHSVTVSETVSRHIQKYIGLKPESISVIHNSFSAAHLIPTCENPRGKVFDLLGLTPGSRLVVTVGRMIDQKGHIELIEAFGEILRNRADVHLAMIGSQVNRTYVEKARGTIESLGIGGNVRLIEPRHDIADFLAAADVFAFPSKYEGLGIALVEAMASGLPCVASDIDVLREIVRPEFNGLLVPVGDRKGLANAILRILDDEQLATSLGNQARIYAHENFDQERKAQEMLRLYEDVLSRKRN